MMVWVVFLAAGIALEAGRHVLIDSMGAARFARQPWLFAAIDVVGLLFSIWMADPAVQLTIFISSTGQISPTLGVPAHVLYVAPVVGFTSLALSFCFGCSRSVTQGASRSRPNWLEGERHFDFFVLLSPPR